MKKSEQVTAALVASIAAVVSVGCSRGRHCEDSLGRRIPDVECTTNSGRYTYPHWVYSGGRSGTYIGGGGIRPGISTSGGGIGGGTTGGSVSRGGFGGSSSAGG